MFVPTREFLYVLQLYTVFSLLYLFFLSFSLSSFFFAINSIRTFPLLLMATIFLSTASLLMPYWTVGPAQVTNEPLIERSRF